MVLKTCFVDASENNIHVTTSFISMLSSSKTLSPFVKLRKKTAHTHTDKLQKKGSNIHTSTTHFAFKQNCSGISIFIETHTLIRFKCSKEKNKMVEYIVESSHLVCTKQIVLIKF